MKDTVTVKNYASALFEASLLEKNQCLEKVKDDLTFLSDLWQEIEHVFVFFTNSVANIQAKLKLWNEAIDLIISCHGYKFHAMTLQFMHLLIINQRVKLFGFIRARFHQLILLKNGITEVHITTAVILSKEKQDEIITEISEILDTKVFAFFHIKKENIAGIVIEVGDIVADMSLRNKLNSIRDYISQ